MYNTEIIKIYKTFIDYKLYFMDNFTKKCYLSYVIKCTNFLTFSLSELLCLIFFSTMIDYLPSRRIVLNC